MDEHQRRMRYARQMAQRPTNLANPRPGTPRIQHQAAQQVHPPVAAAVQPQPKGKGVYIDFAKLKPKRPELSVVNTAIALIVLASLGAAGFYFVRYQNAQAQLNQHNIISPQQQQANKDKIAEIVAKVSKITPLPQGETPTLAEITDITKLSNQPFFAKAQNGDDVLIYSAAKTAYLYRPSTNQIINVAPVTQGGASSPSSVNNTSGTSPNTQTNTSSQTSGH